MIVSLRSTSARLAIAVTLSVQLVGLYLVFATLIVPPLATRRMGKGRLPSSWALGAFGYAAGLLVSTSADLPSGPTIVWALVAAAVVAEVVSRWKAQPAAQTTPIRAPD